MMLSEGVSEVPDAYVLPIRKKVLHCYDLVEDTEWQYYTDTIQPTRTIIN